MNFEGKKIIQTNIGSFLTVVVYGVITFILTIRIQKMLNNDLN